MPLTGATILAVDDKLANLELLSEMLDAQGYHTVCASTGKHALQLAITSPPDLFLLDIQMPEMDGYALCQTIKAIRTISDIPVIFISALHETIDKVKAFAVGGVDYITKPFQLEEVRARVNTHINLRQLNLQLERHNEQLQELVRDQVNALIDAHTATIVALAKLAESRDDDTGNHIRRVQEYCKVLAEQLGRNATFKGQIDKLYIHNHYQTAPLHDIGKVGIPDSILLKPDRLTAQEMEIMKTHTLIGARTLNDVLQTHSDNVFVKMGARIAESHHERWDGSGYPHGLSGESIPLCARILAIADQYDALRNARPYKKPFDHKTSCDTIIEGDGRTMPAHFDPGVLTAFKASRSEFDRVFHTFQDRGARAS
ncbi:MAG: HD domain-containing phosphohydrolase [Terriglobales bacterium]